MGKSILVGMADLNICKSPDTITTLGLGSCVGIALRDPVTKIGGLAHIMLPDSKEITSVTHVPKFADTGIEELVKKVTEAGAVRSRLVAKIAGGAQMFGSASGMFNIGERNVEAAEHVLGAYDIPVIGRDVGGSCARTLYLHTDTGIAEVKTAMRQIRTL